MAGAARSRAPDSTKYVEYEEYVDFQLDKTRGIVKRTDILTTLMALAVGVLGYLLTFVVCDQWVIEGGFGYTARISLLSAVAAIVVGVLAWRVVWPLMRQVNPLYAARVLEKSDPQFQSNLVNFVDVKLANAETAPPVLKSMQKRAAVELSHIDVEEAVDHRPLLRIAYALLGIVVVSALYIFLSPKDVFVSVWRAVAPTSSIAVATKTTITEVDPGNKDVPARTRQTVTAEIRGEAADQAQILFTTADRKYVDEPVKMRRETEGLKKFVGELNGENGKGLLQSLTYRIVAGDARSDDYTIRVMQPPSARVDEVLYEFAKYMELPAKTVNGGDIEAWEGTIVTIKATANMKVARAAIVLTDSDDRAAKGEEISMQVTEGTQLTGTWKLEFRSDGTAPRYYHIQVRTESQKKEEIDTDPTQYALRIRPDVKPDVALLDPTGDLTKPANAIIPLVVQATDPDFKVRSVILRGTRGGDPLFNQDVKLYRDDELPARSITLKYNFRLEPLNLKPGERIQLWIEAKDNKAPTANRATTTPIWVNIEKPVSAKEVEKQLAEDEKIQEEQLARANSENNSDRTGREPAEPRPGDGRDEPPPARREAASPAVSERTDTEEPRGDENDSGENQGAKSPDGQPRKPANNEAALSRLLKKQQTEEQTDQREFEQTEQQPQVEENPDKQLGQEEGEGGGQSGGGKSKSQPKKGTKTSPQAGESGENSSATGEKPGRESDTGDDDSQSAGGADAKTPKKNSQTKRQPKPGSDEADADSNDRDPANNPQKSKKPGKSDGSGEGDQPEPVGKSGKSGKKPKADNPSADKPDDQDPTGAGQNADQNDTRKNQTGKKDPGKTESDQENPQDKPAEGNGGKSGKKKPDQPGTDENGTGSDDEGPKPKPGKTPPRPGTGDQDSPEPDGAGNMPPKNQPDKRQPGKNDTGADGDDQQAKKPGDQGKTEQKAGGSGDENETAGGDQNPEQQKDPGKSGMKPGEKSDVGKKNSDGKSPQGGTSGDSDQQQGGDQSDQKGPQGEEDGGGGSTGKKPSKGGKGTKKTGATDDPSGTEKPTTDDGSAKNDPAAGNESGDKPAQEDDPNRQVPRAGKNRDKKNGSRAGSQQQEQGDDPQQKKANGNPPDDDGAAGGTDDAENAQPAPKGKKPGEKTGKLDEPASDKGVKRRPGEGEKRPDNPTDAGNQEMKGTGRKNGQKSEQSEAGEQGSGVASDQGESGANKKGPGDKSDEPGDNAEAGKETGQPGSQKKGPGSTTKPSADGGQKQDAAGDNPGSEDGGQQGQKGAQGKKGKNGRKSDAGEPGQGGQEGESGDGKNDPQSGSKPGGKPGKAGGKGTGGQESNNEAGGESASSPGAKPGQPGTGQQRSGGGAGSNPGPGKQQSGAGAPPDATPNETNPDDPSASEPAPLTAEEEAAAIENAKKASNLVLKRLKSKLERGEVDQELLDEMGWKGKQDVEKFVRYLEDNLKQDADDNSPEAEARRMQFEETLRNLPVGSETQRRAGSVGKERTIQQTGAKNAPPPREYQKIWESYTRSLSKSGDKTEPKSKPADQPKSTQPTKSTQAKKK